MAKFYKNQLVIQNWNLQWYLNFWRWRHIRRFFRKPTFTKPIHVKIGKIVISFWRDFISDDFEKSYFYWTKLRKNSFYKVHFINQNACRNFWPNPTFWMSYDVIEFWSDDKKWWFHKSVKNVSNSLKLFLWLLSLKRRFVNWFSRSMVSQNRQIWPHVKIMTT